MLSTDNKAIQCVFFLTDGGASTSGIDTIFQRIRDNNNFNLIRVFCLGFGSGVSWSTLEEVSRACNNGLTTETFEGDSEVNYVESTSDHERVVKYWISMAEYINSSQASLEKRIKYFEDKLVKVEETKQNELA